MNHYRNNDDSEATLRWARGLIWRIRVAACRAQLRAAATVGVGSGLSRGRRWGHIYLAIFVTSLGAFLGDLPPASSSPQAVRQGASSAAQRPTVTARHAPNPSVGPSARSVPATATSTYPEAVRLDHPSIYYRLDDRPGQIAQDSSGHNHDGSYDPGVVSDAAGALAQGKDRDAAITSNTNAAAVQGHTGTTGLTSGSAKTFEVWVQSVPYSSVISYGGVSATLYNYSSGPSVGFTTDSGSAGVDVARRPGETWLLYDFTYDGSTVAFYQDGVLQGTAPLANKKKRATDGFAFVSPGNSDELAIYDHVLTADSIDAHWTRGQSALAPCAPAPTSAYGKSVISDSPSAYYQLNDLAAAHADAPHSRVAFDSSRHCRNGSYDPDVVSVSAGALSSGDAGIAVKNTVPAVQGHTGAGQLTSGSARTFEVWARGIERTVISYGGVSVTLWNASSDPSVAVSSDAASASIGVARRPQEWTLYDITYDGSTVAVYQDGGAPGTAKLANKNLRATDGLTIQNPGDYDELAIYDHVLTADQVRAHYLAAKSLPPPPPPPSSLKHLALVPYPLEVGQGRTFQGPIAFLTSANGGHLSQPSDLRATISWGDGSSSPASVVSAGSVVDRLLDNRTGFLIRAQHTYARADVSHLRITVTSKDGKEIQTSTDTVVVDPPHAQTRFFANPDNPQQNGLGLLIPQLAAPDQPKIDTFQWDFADGNRVLDDPQTHSHYDKILSALVSDPGNGDLRRQAVAIGILPQDANGGPFGLGGLSADQVLQVARVWQAYFPYHIVPHLYDYYGTVGIRLTTRDVTGHLGVPFVRNISVTRQCEPWGGSGLFGSLFGGYTVCDTATLFGTGARRHADYIGLDISGSIGKGFQLAGGITLSLTKAHTVFVTVHAAAGIGASLNAPSATVISGWVGPPDPRYNPGPNSVDAFVDGSTVQAGVSALFGGYNVIFSPRGDPGFQWGTETAVGVVPGLGATVGLACSAKIPDLSRYALDAAAKLYGSSHPSTGPLQQLLTLVGGPVVLQSVAVKALEHCVTGS